MNTIGRIFSFTDFGESHGVAVGGVVDGCPAGLKLDMAQIRSELQRRAGKDLPYGVSMRAKTEEDQVCWLSGIKDDITLGSPIAFFIKNQSTHAEDYEKIKNIFRPAHADFTYQAKYGIRDWRGGGRASARETAARVVAGSIAKQLLAKYNINVNAKVIQIGDEIDRNRFADILKDLQEKGDSIGGIVECVIHGMKIGIGEPIFDKLPARLSYFIMSINACKGFEYGSGFSLVNKRGSEINNMSGGALGGISDGTDFTFRCVFKPTPSISIAQRTIDENGKSVDISIRGRHDVCLALRAPVIVESMAAITIADLLLENISRSCYAK